jgi:hypothetical protein
VTIVFRGYQPAGVHNALAFTNGWITRAYAYMLLMRDEYPPVGDEVQVDVDPPAALPAPADSDPQTADPGGASPKTGAGETMSGRHPDSPVGTEGRDEPPSS